MIESRNKSPIMRGMTSRSPAKKWEDALITGNGTMGALVFGQPLNETIIFNHEKLYEPFNETVVQNNELTPILPEVRRQMKNGRFRDAAALFSEKSGHPLLFTDAYHPAFGLNWNQANSGKYRNYSRQVNFETGETIVKWANEASMFERYGFVSRAKGLFVMRMTTSQPGLLSGLFTIDPLLLESSAAGYVEVDENELSYSCAYSKTEKGYVGRVKIVTDGKTTLVHDEKNSIRVQGATEVMVFAKITPLLKINAEHEVAHAQLKADLASVASYSYDELVDEHARIHGEQFARTALTLGEAPLYSGAIEDLLVKKEKEIDEQLVQLMFDMGRYVLISSSGSYPPNLVGIWSGEWRPPWSGDFTTDANVNLAISSASLGCLPEALESYFHLIEKIVPDWRINARTMYGCRGILAGSRTDGNHNIHTHFDVDWPLGFWTAGAAWLIMPYYEWYQVSGDDAFFRNRALPLLKEVALFYEDFLTEEDDQGYAMFIPSYSPENTPVISSELKEQAGKKVRRPSMRQWILPVQKKC
ncbi:large secreted protein [Bacillus sp. JCM 19045]|nr:large secreted protein [Bacillus sp. JCM 19045]